MGKDSFIFYRSFYEAIKDIPPEEQAAVFRAICEYALNGKKPKIKGTASGMFKLIVPQIDANNARYENGKKGGRPNKIKGSGDNLDKTKPKPNHNLDITKPKPNVNVNVNDNVNVNENENVNVNVNVSGSDNADTQHTDSPSLTANNNRPDNIDVACEVVEQKYNMDGNSIAAFMAYNDERGWKMDWKEALRRWAEREKPPDKPKRSPAGRFQNFERNPDNIELEKKIIAML